MEDLIATQQQIMDAMHQLYVNFKKDGADRKTADYIKRRLDTLKAYWREFQTNHIKLCEYTENRSHEYFTENQYGQTESFFTNTRSYIIKYGTELAESLSKQSTSIPEIQVETKPSTPIISPNPIVKPAMFTFPNFETKSQGTNSKLQDMLRKQISNFRAISRTINNIDLSLISDKWEFEDILRTLQSRWSAIDTLHWEIDSESIEDNEDYEREFLKREKDYNNIKRSINSKMWAVSHREQSTPKMEIPTFTGNYHQWVSFKDLFVETVHNNPSLSRAQKMQFLKSKIKGDAEKLIQHLNISTDNYQVCWDILNHRFNNTKLIFTSHINILMNIPTIQQQSAGHIKKIHDTTNECLNAIKNLGVDTSTWDPLLVHLLSQKLDVQTYNDYIECLKHPRDLPTLKEFLDFLENKFTSLESTRRKQEPAKSYQQPATFVNRTHFQKHPVPSFGNKNCHTATLKCALCSNNHGLFHCKTFLEMQPDTKRKTVLKLNLCKNCLYDHNGNPCKSNKKCRHCNENHNSILHDAFASPSNPKLGGSVRPPPQPAPRALPSSNHVTDHRSETLLATVLVKIRTVDGSYKTMRALIDQGSQTSLITENAAQQLGLPRQRCNGVISGIGTKQNNCKGVLSITCMANHCDYSFTSDVLIMKNLINNLPNRSFQKPTWDYLNNIQLADPEFYVSRPIDLLLGAEVYSTIILGGIIREAENQPIAQQTRLGWILCGNVNKTYQCNVVLNNIDDIQKFWEIEDIAENLDLSQDDYECLQFYNSTTKRMDSGRYEVRLPLKTDSLEKLGESKSKAIAQFRQLEKKFIKQENVSKDYKTFIHEYEELGHLRESKIAETSDYFLPHHCVHRAESTTTSLRVVFNGSAKTSTGYSLNDIMYRGPNLQKDLFSLILKWRGYKCAFTADLEKMFRQIMLSEADQKYQKIVWRDSPQQLIREYQLTTVTYGTKAAPFLAMMTLKQLARDESQNYQASQAIRALEEEFYTDDLLSGSHDIISARKLQTDLINLLKSGGFNLRKWTSNKVELLEGVSVNQGNQEIFDFKQIESTKTLGLRWNPVDDKFIFQLSLKQTTSKITKRILLSDISKLFDPLGWLAPITTKLKLLFQKVWLLNSQWDDELPKEIIAEWQEIRLDLNHIKDMEVPRWLESNQNDVIELHGFCDSSTKAYGCVIYCRITKQTEPSTSIVLVAAKTRIVSQNKDVSLPRLELCGAHLLSKLMSKVQYSLAHFNIKVYGWTDSTAVLGWIQGDSGRWKPFVANRVKQINNVMPAECWSYVKSADNPADCASRGITASKLRDHSLWWCGPTWLPAYNCHKNKGKPIYKTDLELNKSKQTNVATLQHSDTIIDNLLSKMSSFTRLVRVMAWIQRAVSRNRVTLPYLTVNELKLAKEKIIKHTQQKEFSEDIQYLEKYLTQLSTRSKWKQVKENIKVDDVVTIDDGNLPAGKWAMGRVVDLHPSKDGIIRVVSLKTKNGVIKRPIVKLSILPVKAETETTKQYTNDSNQGAQNHNNIKTPKSIGVSLFTSFTTIFTLFFIFMTTISTSQALYTLTKLNKSQGLYFDKIGSMQLIREEWKLIVYYNMEPYWEGNTALNKYVKHLNNLCSTIKNPSNCNTIIWELQYAVNDLEYYDRMLLDQHFDVHARQRRGLINGVGYVARSLFGVLDEHFAEQYQRDINVIRDNQKHLALLWKNQTSVVEAEYNLLKRTEDSMYKQHKIINQRMNNMARVSSVLQEEVEEIQNINDFTLSSIIANNLLNNLKSIQNVLMDSVTNLYYGKFSTHLLTPVQLRDELSVISGQLPKDLSLPIENIQTDLRKIYHLLKVRTRMTNQYLIFEIRIPLVSRDYHEIYNIIPVPQQKQDVMTSLVPISTQIAINLRKDTYLPMNENEMRDCIQYDSSNYLCRLQRPIYRMKSENDLCAKDQTSKKFKINSVTCKDTWTELSVINTYLYFCCNQCTLKIICENQLTIEQVKEAGIIALGNDCVIKNDQFTVYSHNQHVSELNLQSNLLIPKIAPINHIINITVPLSTTSLEYNISDHQRSLEEIGEQIKQMKSEQILTDRISYHDVHHYTVIYIVVGTASIAAAVYVWRRVRRCRCVCLARPPSTAASAASGDRVSASVCVSANANANSESVQCVSETLNRNECKQKQNKATSPIFHKFHMSE